MSFDTTGVSGLLTPGPWGGGSGGAGYAAGGVSSLFDADFTEEKEAISRSLNKVGAAIGSAAKACWDAYMSSCNLQQNAQLQQAQMNIDMFDTPEDIERSLDIIEATAGFSVAIYEVAIFAVTATHPVGAALWAIAGVVWAGRAIYRACK